ncbi:hypothetical protein A2361_00320 [Candidatus Woesebacteria bacterium RIFOXYB1_FULL_40_26]|uniref:CxxC-x17-CxxC domain-containing protein n=2 Tax=Candidatus Woeseibacteriota TaxID=1752722 RepID=A0A1F8DKX9_9BACT|nr:MAG: hypothetical protein A2361_00320 [Candidatus Woesebacteria bacterium RIFOXYB1_FULL_40_26]OGM88528.1 MAG: hypothetical protein A2614_00960 [Candidatus Woesebacteria bacterium RIFOXYD1_FULL_40_21]
MNYFNRDNRSGGNRNFGRRSFGDRGDREMHRAICSNCGKECQVPFKPTGSKPVFCSECFEKMGPRRQDSGRPERSDFKAQAPSFDQNKAQFDALNAKLERILGLLEPKVVETVVEEKAPKTKKVKNP